MKCERAIAKAPYGRWLRETPIHWDLPSTSEFCRQLCQHRKTPSETLLKIFFLVSPSPMRLTKQPLGSMGDAPLAVLSDQTCGCSIIISNKLFAQVANPPIGREDGNRRVSLLRFHRGGGRTGAPFRMLNSNPAHRRWSWAKVQAVDASVS